MNESGAQFQVEVRWKITVEGKEWQMSELTTLSETRPFLRTTYPCFVNKPYVVEGIRLWHAVSI